MISQKGFYTLLTIIIVLGALLASHHFTGHPHDISIDEVKKIVHEIQGVGEDSTDALTKEIIDANQKAIDTANDTLDKALKPDEND